jgi:hypothetical protein
MATWSLRRFSCPEVLKSINPDHLVAFLKPHRRFFTSRGVSLPAPNATDEIDYQALVKVFLSPDAKTPKELIDALYFVDELATPEGMDALLAEADRLDLSLDDGNDHTPADVAVQVWLLNKDILERKHAENYLAKVRSFEYYQTDRYKRPAFKRPAFKRPSDKQLAALASDLDDWFEKKKRGRGSRVIMGDQDESVWFLVRHAEPFKREESMDGVETSSVCFRPLKYDVLIYSPHIGELRINARSKGEKQLYRTKLGKHLFGDEDIFPGAEKYTLDPLRENGADSLACFDVDGIEWVKLREVQFFFTGNPWEVVTRKSDDVFKLFESRKKSFPEAGRIIKASFQIKFTDSKTPRTVVIKPSNIAQFARDDDSVLVEKWLEARGFIIGTGAEESEQSEPILASR